MPQPLAEIAIEEGLADAAKVSEASEIADKENIPLVVALIRNLKVDELAVYAALRRRSRIGVTDPADAAPEVDALREVPRDLCRRRRLLPLSLATYTTGPRLMRLAMADPTDAVAIAEVEHCTGCQIEPTLMPLSAVEELTEKVYKQYVTEVMKRGSAGGSAAPQTATVPFRRVVDEATALQRFEALLSILVDRGIVDEDDFEERLYELIKRDK